MSPSQLGLTFSSTFRASTSINSREKQAMSLIRALIFIALFLFTPLEAAVAQKNCKKGIPCGNSCISATKTCRIGTPSKSSDIETPKPQSSTVTKKDSVLPDSLTKSTSEVRDGKVWVNTKSRVYHCSGSRYFGQTASGKYLSEKEAVEQGYRAAYGKKCSP